MTNFNGKQRGLKCTTIGEYSHISHTVCFPRMNCEKRTDAGFRAKIYGTHHKHDNPLILLPIDMIKDFPVGDSLHLIDLGLMKRCPIGWRDGSFGTYKTKWSARDIETFTQFLRNYKMPSEIHRVVRGLDVLCHWKGTEYRTFLYYLGVVILKEVLPLDAYQLFLKKVCAITICSSKIYSNFFDLAEVLLNSYLEYFRDIYGEDHISSNVHNLSHLIDEVKTFGPLSTFSSYPFESRLYQIKNLLRNGTAPLALVAKRISEIVQCENHGWNEYARSHNNLSYPVLKCKNPNDGFFYKVDFKYYILTGDERNRWFLTKDNVIVAMKYASILNGVTYIFGNVVEQLSNVFEIPIKSSFLNIYSANQVNTKIINSYLISAVRCKLVCIRFNNKTFFFSLLHSLDCL